MIKGLPVLLPETLCMSHVSIHVSIIRVSIFHKCNMRFLKGFCQSWVSIRFCFLTFFLLGSGFLLFLDFHELIHQSYDALIGLFKPNLILLLDQPRLTLGDDVGDSCD